MSASIVTALAEWSSLPVEVVKAYCVGIKDKDKSATSLLAVSRAVQLFATAKTIRYEDAKSVLKARLRELASPYNLVLLQRRTGRVFDPRWIGRFVMRSDPAVKKLEAAGAARYEELLRAEAPLRAEAAAKAEKAEKAEKAHALAVADEAAKEEARVRAKARMEQLSRTGCAGGLTDQGRMEYASLSAFLASA